MIQNLTTAQINSLPKQIQELYYEAKENTNNFNERLMSNDIIADAADTVYQKIMEYLNKYKSNEPKTVKLPKRVKLPRRPKAEHELTILEYIQSKFSNQGIETLKDAERARDESGSVRSAFSVHEILVKDAYDNDKNSVSKRVLAYYPDIVNSKKQTPKAKTVKPNRRLAKDQVRNLPMVIRTHEHPKDKEVKANELESQYALTFVKSFLLMIGKKKVRKNLQSLLNRINKAADKKEIRAKSIHAEAVNYVAESLVAALNTDYATFVFKLDKIGSEVLEPYMNTKEALPNVLLRSFYNSQNKKFTKTHSNLLKRLEKVEDKNNPFSIEIGEAIKTLKTAERNNSTIKATKPTLRGLDGICKGHKNDPIKDRRCRAIMASIRRGVPSKKKASLNGFENVRRKAVMAGAASGAIGGMIGTVLQQSLSGVELLEVDYETMDLSFDFSKIGLDDMPKNASILVYGKPKHGKSTFALQLANELSKKGSLLYVANEEMMSDGKPSKSLQDRVKRIGYTHSMRFSKNLNVPLQNFQFIVIDSINALGLDIHAWRDLRNQYPNSFFVLVSQVTKSGVFRGSQEWAHDVDVIVDVKNGKADIMGRFGSGEYEIFNQNIL